MVSPAVDKTYECLRFARAAADDEQRVAWDKLAQLWLNLANERSWMTPYEHQIEAQRLRELEALVIERNAPSRRTPPACIDSAAMERAVRAQLAASF